MKKDINKKKKDKSKVRIWVENVIEIAIVIVCIVFSIIVISNPGGIKKDVHDTNVNFMPVLSESMSGTFEKGDLISCSKYRYDPNEKNILNIGDVITFVAVDKSSNTYYINTHRIAAYNVTYKFNDETFTGYKQFLKDTEGKVKSQEDAYSYAKNLGYTDFSISGYITSGDNKSIYYKDGDINGELIDSSNEYLVDRDIVAFNDVIGTWNGKKVSKLGGVITWIKQPLNFFLVIMIPLILLFAYNIFILVRYIIDMKTAKARKLALEEAKASAPSLSAEEEEEIKRKAVEEYMKKMGIDPNSLPKNDDSSNDDKEEKASVVEPVSDDKVVDEKPVAKKKTTKKSTTGTKKTTKSSKKDGAEEK